MPQKSGTLQSAGLSSPHKPPLEPELTATCMVILVSISLISVTVHLSLLCCILVSIIYLLLPLIVKCTYYFLLVGVLLCDGLNIKLCVATAIITVHTCMHGEYMLGSV